MPNTEENSVLPDFGKDGARKRSSECPSTACWDYIPNLFSASCAESHPLAAVFGSLQLTVLQEQAAVGIRKTPEMSCTAFHLAAGYSKAVLVSSGHLIKNP